jgi:hypothetical protein
MQQSIYDAAGHTTCGGATAAAACKHDIHYDTAAALRLTKLRGQEPNDNQSPLLQFPQALHTYSVYNKYSTPRTDCGGIQKERIQIPHAPLASNACRQVHEAVGPDACRCLSMHAHLRAYALTMSMHVHLRAYALTMSMHVHLRAYALTMTHAAVNPAAGPRLLQPATKVAARWCSYCNTISPPTTLAELGAGSFEKSTCRCVGETLTAVLPATLCWSTAVHVL